MTVDASTQQDTDSESTAAAPGDAATSTDSTDGKAGAAAQSDSGSAADAPQDSQQGEAKPKRGRPKGSSTAKKSRTVELHLTVTGTADGEWQAELKQGTTWLARGVEVPAAAVSKAAKELHADLAGPIDEVIESARETQRAKVAELEAELAKAKEALAGLEE